MERSDRRSAESWIGRAKSSYDLATVSITPNIYYEDLCFQIQQSAEKALKGLLIYYGVEPDFTHNIGMLLEELEKLTDIPSNIKEASELTMYAVQTRYPGEYDEITKEEYKEAVKIAKTCIEWTENKIKENKKQ
ncbi:DNA-binding protein [Spirochaetia bacterium]|nr:DNA-binding protein [Spirochaetia bacterium]